MTCWVGVASRNHVMRAVKGGFCQVNHGKAAPLDRMRRDDHMLYYSPRQEMLGGEPVQAFTAIGRIDDDEPYQVQQADDFEPFRRKVHYFKSHDAPIRPMLDDLALTRDRKSWGIAFRRGMFAIGDEDYHTIARAMGVPQRGQSPTNRRSYVSIAAEIDQSQ